MNWRLSLIIFQCLQPLSRQFNDTGNGSGPQSFNSRVGTHESSFNSQSPFDNPVLLTRYVQRNRRICLEMRSVSI